MGLISRLQYRFKSLAAFQPLSGGLNFSGKGKDGIGYFGLEQGRLLGKLKQIFSPQQKCEAASATDIATKSAGQGNLK